MSPSFFRIPKSQTLFYVRSEGDCPFIVPRSWHQGRSDVRQLSLSLWTRGIDTSEAGYYLLTEDEACHYIPETSRKKVVEALISHRPDGWMQRSKPKTKPTIKPKNKTFVELKIDFTVSIRNPQRIRIEQLLAAAQRSRNKQIQAVRVRALSLIHI